ncbi:MAG: RnfABCDGE type electron transport complex subunit B [Oscillospiraceae bacterium]|nr:RnfABCDGE type electron transport complex subunit B [Oscillospiraceae bacterium]
MFTQYFLPVIIFIGLGSLAGIALSVASTVFAVPENEYLKKLRQILPGINCGACGYNGCDEYAYKVIEGEPLNLCTPGGDKVAEEISEILGREFEDVVEKVAFARCAGIPGVSGQKYEYTGPPSCAGSAALYGGHGDCTYKCLGFGDCVEACPYDAIDIVDFVAIIDRNKCTGCIACVAACPKEIIEIRKDSGSVYVACANCQAGKDVRKICKRGCIACGICAKKCSAGAITVENYLANIDYDKCTDCGECVSVCPTGCITQK